MGGSKPVHLGKAQSSEIGLESHPGTVLPGPLRLAPSLMGNVELQPLQGSRKDDFIMRPTGVDSNAQCTH